MKLMGVQEVLLSKNGYVTMQIANEFLQYRKGDKIPTVTELSEKYKTSRGTMQNAIKLLQNKKVIRLEPRGHLGTFLVQKDMALLLQYANIKGILGTMPLPYSKKYEGLASGLVKAMVNEYKIPAYLTFMRGARNRIAMLVDFRCEFAIVSLFAAKQHLEFHDDIEIVKRFGIGSYLGKHVILLRDKGAHAIQNGMRVGIDITSIDQLAMTQHVCRGKQVQFVEVGYSQIIKNIIEGKCDAAIWNEDEILDKFIQVNYVPVEEENEEDTEAVLIVSKKRPEMKLLLNEIIDEETVLSVQSKVINREITPIY